MTQRKVLDMTLRLQGLYPHESEFNINLRPGSSSINRDYLVNRQGLNKFIRKFNKFSMLNPKTNFCRITYSKTNIDETCFLTPDSKYSSQDLFLLPTPTIFLKISAFVDVPYNENEYSTIVRETFHEALLDFFADSSAYASSMFLMPVEQIIQTLATYEYKLIISLSEPEKTFISNSIVYIKDKVNHV